MRVTVDFRHPLLVGGSHGANTILRHEAQQPGRARGLLPIAPGGNALRRPPVRTFALLRLALWRGGRKGMAALIPGGTFYEIERVAGRSAAQVADVAADRIHRWADDVLARR